MVSGKPYKRKDRDSWEQALFVDGKKVRLSAKTKILLNKKVEDYISKHYRGELVNKSTVTLNTIMNAIQDNKLNLNQISEVTYKRNIETIDLINRLGLGDMPIQKITLNDLNTFSNKVKTYSQSTIQKVFLQIKLAFNRAVQDDILFKNILDNYNYPISEKKKKKVRAFTIEEQKEFLELIPESEYYMQYLMAIHTGMRMRRNKCSAYKRYRF